MAKLAKAIPGQKPIVIGAFTLTATGLEIEGKPSWDEYDAVGDWIRRAHQASAWWLADWIKYAELRPDWAERFAHVVDATHYSEQTVRNIKYIGENVAPARRRADLSFSLHSEVAKLSAPEQTQWLEKASVEGWSVRELRAEIRASKRVKIIEGQATLEGMYRVIYADPPWLYRDSGATVDGSLGKQERAFPGMTIDELCKLPVEAHALPNSILFMWVTATMLLENPGPREVIEAWGFKPKTGWVWDKVLGMPGHYSHVVHEHLIIATRGDHNGMDVPTPQPKSIIVERRQGEHSEKPEQVRKLIEKHWTTGPYLELFGRKPVEGWSVFGNDARLWAQEAQAS